MNAETCSFGTIKILHERDLITIIMCFVEQLEVYCELNNAKIIVLFKWDLTVTLTGKPEIPLIEISTRVF